MHHISHKTLVCKTGETVAKIKCLTSGLTVLHSLFPFLTSEVFHIPFRLLESDIAEKCTSKTKAALSCAYFTCENKL